jgi:hypothetical protein
MNYLKKNESSSELFKSQSFLFCFAFQIGAPLILDVADSLVQQGGENGAKF